MGGSGLDEFFLVVDLAVQVVEVLDQVAALERHVWLLEIWVLLLDFLVQFLPLLVEVLSVVLVLLHGVLLLLLRVHLQSLVEGKRVDLLQDGLQGDQRLLQDLVPVVVSQVDDDRHQHGEGLVLVSLQNVEEVVVLEEAHGAVGDLEVDAADALDDSLEELVDQVLDLVDLADLEHLLQLGQEEGFLDAVGEWPVFEQALQERDGQGSVLGQEEHGASQELLVELRASLDLVQGDDDVLEKDDVFLSQWHCESANNTSQNVQQLGRAVEFMGLVDQGEEALVDGLADHLSARNQLGVELVQDVLEVVSLDGLLRVEELEEFLHELGSDVHLQRPNFDCLVDDELQEEFIDSLQMRPGWFNLVLGFDSGLRELQVGLLEVRQWPEDVFLDHGHDIVQVGNDQTHNRFLVLQQLLDFVDGVQSFGLPLDVLRLVLVVVRFLANQQFLLEGLLRILVRCGATSSWAWCRSSSSSF